MTATTKLVYHIGDTVQIVEPQIVLRVGYPLTLLDGMVIAEEKWSAKVYEFIKSLGTVELSSNWELDGYDSRLYADVINALGSYHLRTVRFGGRERSIHTQTAEELRNTSDWNVISKRRVKTGTYCVGGRSSDDWGDDYDPPYLSNEQTHVLLLLQNDRVIFDFNDRVEIECCNVQLQAAAPATTGGKQ